MMSPPSKIEKTKYVKFQSISGCLHETVQVLLLLSERGDWQLLCVETLWQCLCRCWHQDVYLARLCHRFWKLSLQLLARYTTALADVMATEVCVNACVIYVEMLCDGECVLFIISVCCHAHLFYCINDKIYFKMNCLDRRCKEKYCIKTTSPCFKCSSIALFVDKFDNWW